MSKNSKSNLPTITSNIDKDLRIWTDRARELLEGKGGFIVTRDALIGGGLASGGPGGSIAPPEGENETELIPIFTPPAPAFLRANGGWAYINLEWNQPPYYGHLRSQVYRAEGAVALDAPVESELTYVHGQGDHASVWSDNVGTGKTFTYFVRFVNLLGVKGPYSKGATATTAIDVEEALDALSNSITTSELASDLTALVDGLEDNYIVKIQKGGVASGFGLVSTEGATTGKVESTFAILANRFALLPPVEFDQYSQPSNSLVKNGDLWRSAELDEDDSVASVTYKLRVKNKWEDFDPVPFVVQSTPTTLPNSIGDDIEIPAGVYIRDAYIMDASIKNAKMGVASIDNANIAKAAITRAKIATLDAASITSGAIKSYGFNASQGAGFFLQLGSAQLEIEEGETYPQEEVAFILRSAGNSKPALQLISGVVTISGLVIRDFLQSITYNDPEKAGWQFNVEDGTFRIKNAAQETILASGGTEGLEDPNFILAIIKDKIAAIEEANKEAKDDAKAASDAAGGAQGTANTANGTASTAKSQVDILKRDLDATFTRDSYGGGYTFTNDFKDFFTNDNDLKDFAFLDKVTPANVSTYIATGAIKQAAIGRAAIGVAQIKDLAVETAKIAEAAVKTLQIDGNAVVVGYAKKGAASRSPSKKIGGNDDPFGGTLQIVASCSVYGREDGSGTITIYSNEGSGSTTETIELRQSNGSFNAFSFPISACHNSNPKNGNVGWSVTCSRTSGDMTFGAITATINVLKR